MSMKDELDAVLELSARVSEREQAAFRDDAPYAVYKEAYDAKKNAEWDCFNFLRAHGASLRAAVGVNAELLDAVEQQYIALADIRNQWPARHTPPGQAKLIRLRDLIAKATGRDPQEVQDDYGTRAARASENKTP